jgi:putative nucleotidyltransferase with HDIG domain
MKTKIHLFNSGERKELPAAGLVRGKIVGLLQEREFWWGVLFVTTLLFLFVTRVRYTVPNLQLGEISQSTVRAPRDIQVPDTATTERKRKEAEQKVFPVYDYDPALVNSSVSRMHEVFAFARKALASEGARPDLTKLSEAINSEMNVYVDPQFLTAARKKDFNETLENLLTDKLRKAMSQYIISDRNILFLYASKGLTIRNQDTGKEETMTPTGIQDIRNIQDSIKKELIQEAQLDVSAAALYWDFLSRFIAPTIYFNNAETQSRIQAAGQSIEPVYYQIKKGRVIVRDGEEITPAVLAQLHAIQQSEQRGPPIRYSVGIILLLAFYFIALKNYLNAHQHTDIKLRDKALFQLWGLVLLGNVVLVRLGLLVASSVSATFSSPPFNHLFAYQIAVPFAAGALLLSVLTDRQMATIYSFGFAILVGVLTRGDFYLAFYALANGIAAAFSIKRYYQRSALLRSCFWTWLGGFLAVVIVYLLRESRFDLKDVSFLAACAFVSALLSAGVTSVMSPFLEWLFNITTDIKLLELSNLDLPVLRQLALEAPGTYHHSIVMGTIAEAAAEKVGANPLFLRVAALYHDVGKVRKSEYYVENQREINKHDALNPRMSALVIINHVKEGTEVARMLRLPSDLCAMIPQHHGTRLITYFYKKAKDMENPEIEEVKEADYRYPGPKPQTKEAAILMLADAVEAASRTLTEPTPARLQNLVDTLFRAIFEDGQLDESNLTMKDLNLIADAFVRKLESVFHHRITYPGYEFNRDEKARDTGEPKELPEKLAH